MHKISRFFVFSILILLSLVTSCVKEIPELGYWDQKVDVEPMSRTLIAYANELRHELGLRFEDSNIYYDEFVKGVRIIFSTQAILELKETRELVVDVVEGLLKRMNADPVISSQFECGFMSADQVELYISFESYFNEYVDQEYIGWVSLIDGITRFYAGIIKDPYLDFWHARTEPYSKSLQFVTFEREAETAYEAAHPPNQGPGPAYDVLIE